MLSIAQAQPPVTSDLRQTSARPADPVIYPGRAPFFVSPTPFWFVEFATNHRPIVVETTITSNVMVGTIWYHNNVRQTNYEIKSSNLVSRTTNSVP